MLDTRPDAAAPTPTAPPKAHKPMAAPASLGDPADLAEFADPFSIESRVTEALLDHLHAGIEESLAHEQNGLRTLACRVERAAELVSQLSVSAGARDRGDAHRLLIQTGIDLRTRAAALQRT